MRWLAGIACVALLGWILFLASPFVALYRLADAVESRDAQALTKRVNFAALRASLLEQVVDEYLKAAAVEPGRRRAAAGMAAVMADPVVARLATPEALLDLFADGWPEAVAGPRAPGEGSAAVSFASLGDAARLFAASETRGFRKIVIPVPPDRPRAEAFALTFRLKGPSWRLMSVELPASLRRRLVRDLPRPNA